MSRDTLYVYTAKHHPKRGHRYGQHFRITRAYKDIKDVIWRTDGRKGHVRDGEYLRIDHWWAQIGPAWTKSQEEAHEHALQADRALRRILSDISWAKVLRESKQRRETRVQQEANAFRLEGGRR